MLLNQTCNALWCWRNVEGEGVNCSVFRNESNTLSSELIQEACDIAWLKWPGKRLFTFVNPQKIKSVNPGCCFKKAGWKSCGMSKAGLHILELRRQND